MRGVAAVSHLLYFILFYCILFYFEKRMAAVQFLIVWFIFVF